MGSVRLTEHSRWCSGLALVTWPSLCNVILTNNIYTVSTWRTSSKGSQSSHVAFFQNSCVCCAVHQAARRGCGTSDGGTGHVSPCTSSVRLYLRTEYRKRWLRSPTRSPEASGPSVEPVAEPGLHSRGGVWRRGRLCGRLQPCPSAVGTWPWHHPCPSSGHCGSTVSNIISVGKRFPNS